jgi:sensor histidine kinase YesM
MFSRLVFKLPHFIVILVVIWTMFIIALITIQSSTDRTEKHKLSLRAYGDKESLEYLTPKIYIDEDTYYSFTDRWLVHEVEIQAPLTSFILRLDYPFIDSIIVIKHNFLNLKKSEIIEPIEGIVNSNFYINTFVPEENILFIYTKSKNRLILPIEIYTPLNYIKFSFYHSLVVGAYIGIIILVLCYSIVFYISTNDLDFANYWVMLIPVSITQFIIIGLGHSLPLAQFGIDSSQMLLVFAPLTVFGTLYFSYNYLDILKDFKILKFVYWSLIFLSIINIIIGLSGYYEFAFHMLDIVNSITAIYILYLLIGLRYQNIHKHKIFLLAWSGFLLGAVIHVSASIGIFQYNKYAYYAMTFGSAIEALMVSLMMTIRHKSFNALSIEMLELNLNFSGNKIFNDLEIKRLKKQIKKTQNQLLITQMDPHFIFNALNSINSVIVKKDFVRARTYLLAFSKFMRSLLYVRENDYILLEDEVEILEGYIELEEHRIGQNVESNFIIEYDIDDLTTFVPTMILQPILENSLWHGFSLLTGRTPVLSIHFERLGKNLAQITVEDNGIGREAAGVAQKGFDKKDSFGLKIVNERLSIICGEISQEYKEVVYSDVLDKKGEVVGTKAVLQIPIKSQREIVMARAENDPEFAKKAQEYLDNN